MINLLKETIEDIKHYNHRPEDIVFVGSRDGGYSCTWDEFTLLADREYDEDYGNQEVTCDLTIVFSDGFQMSRWEYDGSEGWMGRKPFVLPTETKRIKTLFKDTYGAGTLSENNEGEE